MAASIAELENEARYCEFIAIRLRGCTGGSPSKEGVFKLLGVEHLYLFGSIARGEAREDSDVDLFFDHPEGSLGLYQLRRNFA